MAECSFFPCSTTLPGTIFLVTAYSYLLLRGAELISDGSELLLEVSSPGLIGGLLLPVLGALPDSAIILVAGLFGDQDRAQEQVEVGVGTLAGSTIMLLSLTWGGCLLYGRCDLNDRGTAIPATLTRPWNLLRTGITTDDFTPMGALIMMCTAALYLIVQVPALVWGPQEQSMALVGSFVCLLTLAGYCAFQMFVSPELQKKRIEAARLKYMRMRAIKTLEEQAAPFGSLLTEDGTNICQETIQALFMAYDIDGNGYIDQGELSKLLLTLAITSEEQSALSSQTEYWLREFDTDADGRISMPEFNASLSRWILEKRAEALTRRQSQMKEEGLYCTFPGARSRSGFGASVQNPFDCNGHANTNGHAAGYLPLNGICIDEGGSRDGSGHGHSRSLASNGPDIRGFVQGRRGSSIASDELSFRRMESSGSILLRQLSLGDNPDAEDNTLSEPDCGEEALLNSTLRERLVRAVLSLAGGVLLCAVFSEPLVNAVTSSSRASGIPPFFVSFCITPFASNASELISSFTFAGKKRKKNISLTFSQIYGAVTMNNTMCLGLFLLVVHIRGLPWIYTSEVVVTIGTTVVVGMFGFRRTTFQAIWAIPSLLLFPISIAAVYYLDTVFNIN